MGVSLRWLVRQAELGLRVLAGGDRLDREVVWAHSIELANPVPWLSGGELLLTTGLRLPERDETRREYVRRLADSGVAAIGFGTGLSHERVPDALVETAEETGLPLLEVPLPTPFVAVTKAVMQRLAEQQYEGVVQASRIQPRMTRAAVRGGAQAVVRELAVSTKSAVLFLDTEGRARAAHPPTATRPDPAVLARVSPGDQASAVVSSGPEGLVALQQVRVGPRVHGRLVLMTERRLTPVDHLLLGHAASLVALDADKPKRLRDEQNRMNGLFLGMLLDGAIAGPAAGDHLAEAGLPVREGIRVLALRGANLRQLLEVADDLLTERNLPLFGVIRDASAALLLPGGHGMTAQAIADAARSRLRTRVWAGLSAVHDPGDGAVAAHEAVNAASAAQARGGTDVLCFEALAGRALLAAPETRSILERLAMARLGPLATHDAEHGTELLESLRAFLEHNGQWEAASVSLGVHRHTLRGRIERVRAVIGADLDSAHVRAELLMALAAWREPGG